MLNKIDSYDIIKDKQDHINELAEENQRINRWFDTEELRIETYKKTSTKKLLFQSVFYCIFYIIGVAVCVYILTHIMVYSIFDEVGWMIILFSIILAGGIMIFIMIFIYENFIVTSFVFIFYFSGYYFFDAPLWDAILGTAIFAPLLVSLLFLHNQYDRKKEANIVLKNEKEINRLTKEIETILTNELIPLLYQENINILETVIIDTQLGFLPKKIIENAFKGSSNR